MTVIFKNIKSKKQRESLKDQTLACYGIHKWIHKWWIWRYLSFIYVDYYILLWCQFIIINSQQSTIANGCQCYPQRSGFKCGGSTESTIFIYWWSQTHNQQNSLRVLSIPSSQPWKPKLKSKDWLSNRLMTNKGVKEIVEIFIKKTLTEEHKDEAIVGLHLEQGSIL